MLSSQLLILKIKYNKANFIKFYIRFSHLNIDIDDLALGVGADTSANIISAASFPKLWRTVIFPAYTTFALYFFENFAKNEKSQYFSWTNCFFAIELRHRRKTFDYRCIL